MSTDECHGCRKTLPYHHERGYAYIFGDQHTFCSGRNGRAKKACLLKALYAFHDSGRCPVCKTRYCEHGTPLCSICAGYLHYGAAHENQERKTRQESVRDAITDLVVVIANHQGFGEQWGRQWNNAWPFSAADPKPQSVVGATLRRALRGLWENIERIAHAEGVVEGANLLARLKSGEVGLIDFQTQVCEAQESIPKNKDDLVKLAREAVEHAATLLEKETA